MITLDFIAQALNTTAAELRGAEKYRPLSDKRQAAYFYCREDLGMTFPAIAKMFNRHHSSIIYGCSTFRALLSTGDRVADILYEDVKGSELIAKCKSIDDEIKMLEQKKIALLAQ